MNSIATSAPTVHGLLRILGHGISNHRITKIGDDPPNAILNYCYALLESEARLVAATIGLDPGIGMLHADTPNRDSLACDIMEAVRPSVDAWLLDWIVRAPFGVPISLRNETGIVG